jgi:hypothetical protein
MSKVDNNKRADDDVLRAGDIIPPYKVKPAKTSAGQAESREHEVPRFNLAEEIMAEQRKVAAVKRKAPSRNHQDALRHNIIPIRPQSKTESVRHAVMPPDPLLFNQQQVIMEIVARDIAQMRRDFVSRKAVGQAPPYSKRFRD